VSGTLESYFRHDRLVLPRGPAQRRSEHRCRLAQCVVRCPLVGRSRSAVTDEVDRRGTTLVANWQRTTGDTNENDCDTPRGQFRVGAARQSRLAHMAGRLEQQWSHHRDGSRGSRRATFRANSGDHVRPEGVAMPSRFSWWAMSCNVTPLARRDRMLTPIHVQNGPCPLASQRRQWRPQQISGSKCATPDSAALGPKLAQPEPRRRFEPRSE
jgi:hypothetical protein